MIGRTSVARPLRGLGQSGGTITFGGGETSGGTAAADAGTTGSGSAAGAGAFNFPGLGLLDVNCAKLLGSSSTATFICQNWLLLLGGLVVLVLLAGGKVVSRELR